MLYNLCFSPSKCRLFHNSTLFGFCITHILNTGCAKIWKKIRRQKVRHPERGVRKMFPTVAATLGEVCSCGRELCWRQLGWNPRKLYLLHVLWSVRILFEQTSYMQTRVSYQFEMLTRPTLPYFTRVKFIFFHIASLFLLGYLTF